MADRLQSGPNWIHGTDNNPILDLAKETNTTTMNWDGRQAVVDALGRYLSDKEAAENTELVWSIIEGAMKHSNAESATIDPGRSLYNFFEEAVQKLFTDEKEEEAKKKRETILQMSEMWGAFVGSEIQKQSLKFFWMEECIDGENLFVAGTYKKVLEKIAEPAREAGINYQCRVKKLVSNPSDESADPSVTVELEGPRGTQRETFDEVVMTAPLGWLKTNLDAFEPALPQRLQEGIAAIGYGHLDKVNLHLHHYLSSVTLLTPVDLHHLPNRILEHFRYHTHRPIRLHKAPVSHISHPSKRPRNNRSSPSAQCRRIPCRPYALRRLHILHRALVRFFHKSRTLEPRSRQSRCATWSHCAPNTAVLHTRPHKQARRRPRN